MQLYVYLDKIDDRALYFDTDSVIFVQKDCEPPLVECDDALGVMISELKDNEYISEFVSGGPKTAYKVCNSVTEEEKTVCNVRGITINYEASQLMDFNAIKSIFLNRSLTNCDSTHR